MKAIPIRAVLGSMGASMQRPAAVRNGPKADDWAAETPQFSKRRKSRKIPTPPRPFSRLARETPAWNGPWEAAWKGSTFFYFSREIEMCGFSRAGQHDRSISAPRSVILTHMNTECAGFPRPCSWMLNRVQHDGGARGWTRRAQRPAMKKRPDAFAAGAIRSINFVGMFMLCSHARQEAARSLSHKGRGIRRATPLSRAP